MILIFDELKNDFNAFLKNNALWIALVLVGVVAIALALILILNRKSKKKPTPQIAEKSQWIEVKILLLAKRLDLDL